MSLKKLTHSLLAKICAVFLLVIVILSTSVMALMIGSMAYFGGYVSSKTEVKNRVVSDVLFDYTMPIASRAYSHDDVGEYDYGPRILYAMKNGAGELVAGEEPGETLPYSCTFSFSGDTFSVDSVYQVILLGNSFQNYDIFEINALADAVFDAFIAGELPQITADGTIGYQIYGENGQLLEEFPALGVDSAEEIYRGEYRYTVEDHDSYLLTLYTDDSFLDYHPSLELGLGLLSIAYNWRYSAILFALAGVIAFFVLLVFLYCSAGYREGSDEVVIGRVDKIPFDLYTLIFVGIFLGESFFLQSLSWYAGSVSSLLCFGFFLLVDFLLLLSYTMSFAVRFKVGGLLKNTVVYKAASALWRGVRKLVLRIRYLCVHVPLIWRTVLVLSGFVLFNLFLTLIVGHLELTFIWILECAMIVPVVMKVAIALKKIQQGGLRIAEGDFQFQINTRHMFTDFKQFGEALNHIGLGMSKAVEEQIRSERLKTELITNVSHDIKTPLTSIINYVDLIKKEHPENETMREYIDVLDRQSERLKKLIEDLVEASKASTGNLAVDMAPADVGVLFSQAIGEYQERLMNHGLEMIVHKPKEPVTILADGRHLWRVFDNLLNNILKYAQPQTRVYLSLERIEDEAVITFRNISKYELNISGDELMERFVRGDGSRNTEGHGLGLSIAQSLVALQNGRMELVIDGDLFKVILTFHCIDYGKDPADDPFSQE